MVPAATEGDVLTYTRDARLQLHTERDAEILEKFETCVQLAKDASEIDQRLWKQILDFLPGHPRSEQEKQIYDADEKRAKDESGTAQKLLQGSACGVGVAAITERRRKIQNQIDGRLRLIAFSGPLRMY